MALFNKKALKKELEIRAEAVKQYHHAVIAAKTIIDQVDNLVENVSDLNNLDSQNITVSYIINRVEDSFYTNGISTEEAQPLSHTEKFGILTEMFGNRNNTLTNKLTFNNKTYEIINPNNINNSITSYYDSFKNATLKVASNLTNAPDFLEASFLNLFSLNSTAGSLKTKQGEGEFERDELITSNLDKTAVYNYCTQHYEGDDEVAYCELFNYGNKPMLQDLFIATVEL